MEAIVFVGIQASGKSSFYRERFFNTHVRINLDMLRTRHREEVLLDTCIAGKIAFVVDNTNPTIEDRARYISAAKAAAFRVVGYYFQSEIEACKERNAGRHSAQQVPLPGLLSTHARLQLPTYAEGFDALFYVQLAGNEFVVEEWKDEV